MKAADIVENFNINLYMASNWIKKWIEKEFLMRCDEKQIRNIEHKLTERYFEEISRNLLCA